MANNPITPPNQTSGLWNWFRELAFADQLGVLGFIIACCALWIAYQNFRLRKLSMKRKVPIVEMEANQMTQVEGLTKLRISVKNLEEVSLTLVSAKAPRRTNLFHPNQIVSKAQPNDDFDRKYPRRIQDVFVSELPKDQGSRLLNLGQTLSPKWRSRPETTESRDHKGNPVSPGDAVGFTIYASGWKPRHRLRFKIKWHDRNRAIWKRVQ